MNSERDMMTMDEIVRIVLERGLIRIKEENWSWHNVVMSINNNIGNVGTRLEKYELTRVLETCSMYQVFLIGLFNKELSLKALDLLKKLEIPEDLKEMLNSEVNGLNIEMFDNDGIPKHENLENFTTLITIKNISEERFINYAIITLFWMHKSYLEASIKIKEIFSDMLSDWVKCLREKKNIQDFLDLVDEAKRKVHKEAYGWL